MGDTTSDLLLLSAIQQTSRQQRIQSIQDMYGAKADDFKEFTTKNNINYNWGKTAGWSAVGAIALGALGFALGKFSPAEGALAADALATNIATGAFASLGLLSGGLLSTASDSSKAGAAYDKYLTEFAGKAREAHEKQRAPTPSVSEPEASKAPEKQWAEDVASSRATAGAAVGVP